MQLLKDKRFDGAIIRDSAIEKIKYDNCLFLNCDFRNVTWAKCNFNNTSFLGNTTLNNCKFVDCKFTGQHTSLGGPAIYSGCDFSNTLFKNIQFWGATFINCGLAGTAHNVLFYGTEAPKGWETIFDNVDIRQLKLEYVDFRCNFDLSTTTR
jgi:uncharacterized protein YjbI with pentapeptide repeats